MKIKLGVLESDITLLNRFSTALATKFSDKLEVYSFSNLEKALSSVESTRIDVLLASLDYEISSDMLPKTCGFAYMVDSKDIKSIREEHAICRFQKIDLIYKDILSVFSEKESIVAGENGFLGNCKLIMFTGLGGTGASTAAAACALNFAARGKRVLYLNLEKYGSADVFFNGEGQFTMSDIVYSIKSRKSNLSLKLESSVKHDNRGVYYFSRPNLVLDFLELKTEDLKLLINTLKASAQYDYIIVDKDFGLSEDDFAICDMVQEIIMVADGAEISNLKLIRVFEALKIIDQEKDHPLTKKIKLLYNRFSNKTGQIIENEDITGIGGIPRFEHANTQQIITQISGMAVFNLLV